MKAWVSIDSTIFTYGIYSWFYIWNTSSIYEERIWDMDTRDMSFPPRTIGWLHVQCCIFDNLNADCNIGII